MRGPGILPGLLPSHPCPYNSAHFTLLASTAVGVDDDASIRDLMLVGGMSVIRRARSGLS